jgi:hypothetical protein
MPIKAAHGEHLFSGRMQNCTFVQRPHLQRLYLIAARQRPHCAVCLLCSRTTCCAALHTAQFRVHDTLIWLAARLPLSAATAVVVPSQSPDIRTLTVHERSDKALDLPAAVCKSRTLSIVCVQHNRPLTVYDLLHDRTSLVPCNIGAMLWQRRSCKQCWPAERNTHGVIDMTRSY